MVKIVLIFLIFIRILLKIYKVAMTRKSNLSKTTATNPRTSSRNCWRKLWRKFSPKSNKMYFRILLFFHVKQWKSNTIFEYFFSILIIILKFSNIFSPWLIIDFSHKAIHQGNGSQGFEEGEARPREEAEGRVLFNYLQILLKTLITNPIENT